MKLLQRSDHNDVKSIRQMGLQHKNIHWSKNQHKALCNVKQYKTSNGTTPLKLNLLQDQSKTTWQEIGTIWSNKLQKISTTTTNRKNLDMDCQTTPPNRPPNGSLKGSTPQLIHQEYQTNTWSLDNTSRNRTWSASPHQQFCLELDIPN